MKYFNIEKRCILPWIIWNLNSWSCWCRVITSVYRVPLQHWDIISPAHGGSCYWCWCWHYVCVFLPSEILCTCLKTQKTSCFSGEFLPLFFFPLSFSFRPVRFCAVGFVIVVVGLCCGVWVCDWHSCRLQISVKIIFCSLFICFIFLSSFDKDRDS